MGHRSAFTAALPQLYQDGGEDAVFTPATGPAIACHVFLDFRPSFDPTGMETQVFRRVATIDALLSEIGRDPVQGETFTIDSVVYTVQAPIDHDGISVIVEATWT